MEAEAFAAEASGEVGDSAAVSVVDSGAFEAGLEVSEEALALTLAVSVVPSSDAASDVGSDSALGSALATRGSITLIRPIPITHTTDAILTLPSPQAHSQIVAPVIADGRWHRFSESILATTSSARTLTYSRASDSASTRNVQTPGQAVPISWQGR